MSEIDPHSAETFSLIINFARYHKTSEEALQDAKSKELREHHGTSISDLRFAVFFKADEIKEINDRFDTSFSTWYRYASTVMIFTLLETRARAFCEELRKRRQLDIGLRDLNGSLLERIKIFTEKIAKIEIKVAGYDIWNELESFQAIRNCIVHTNGAMDEYGRNDKKRLEGLVGANIGVSINEDGGLFLNEEICGHFLRITCQWFQAAYEVAEFGPPFESYTKDFSLEKFLKPKIDSKWLTHNPSPSKGGLLYFSQ